MDLKEAVDLYRDALRRFMKGFSLDEMVQVIARSMGAERAVVFMRRDSASFMEEVLGWRGDDGEYARKGMILPLHWLEEKGGGGLTIMEPSEIAGSGLEDLCPDPSYRLLLLPVRVRGYLRAALAAAYPPDKPFPRRESFLPASVSTILEKLVELLEREERVDIGRIAEEEGPLEMGILTNYVLQQATSVRGVSLGLDLLIKLLNMDGGTVHRVVESGGSKRAVLLSSRGWEGVTEIVDHLFRNNLITWLESLQDSGPGEMCLDAGRIARCFPSVKPYFHANQVKSFLLMPIHSSGRLVGVLSLFGKSYAALEPRDMEILQELTGRLGDLFVQMQEEEEVRAVGREKWEFPALTEDLAALCTERLSVDDFMARALRMVAVEIKAPMSFAYAAERVGEGERFYWYADSVYGGEAVFRPAPGLKRAAAALRRMAVMKPEDILSREMPAAEAAAESALLLLLVPASDADYHFLLGLYLPRERRLSREEIGSLEPLAALLLRLFREREEATRAEGYLRCLELLAEIEGDLAAGDDPCRILRVVAGGGKELLGCRRAGGLIFDSAEGTFKGVVEGSGEVGPEDLVSVMGGHMVRALEKGIPYEGEEAGRGPLPPEEERGPVMVLPLAGGEGCLGGLVFERAKGDREFSDLDRSLARFLAGQAVAVLERRLEGERLREREGRSRFLLNLALHIHSSSDLEDMSDTLYRELHDYMNVDFLLISLQGKRGTRSTASLQGEKLDTSSFQDILLDPRGNLAVTLSRLGKTVRNNLNTLVSEPGEEELVLRGIRSYAAVAFAGEETKGVLLAGSLGGKTFAADDVLILEGAGRLVGSVAGVLWKHEALRDRVSLLEDLCRRQEEAVREKTDLINMASHEVRHPLTLIMGFAEILRDYGEMLDRDESREVVDKLGKAADRLRRSVVNMMEVSRLESGRLTVKWEEVDLEKLLENITEEVRARSEAHRLDINLEEGARRIRADRDKLEIILFNLVENAAKYSPPGSRIEIIGRRTLREVVVGVRDEGPGISEEDLQRIFQPFRRGEKEAGSCMGGMGLGLYIVNKLVEAHGGRIEARSTRGEGSTFIVHLPQPEPVERELGEDLLRA